MSYAGQNLLSVKDVDRTRLDQLFDLADRLQPVARGRARTDVLRGAVMGSLFFEPSTRTRLSFESAFLKLGGSVSTTTDSAASSLAKGESYTDTGRVVGGYYDVLVVRHSDPTAIEEMAATTTTPVISGGSGAKEHPTQALLDTYTIRQEFGRLGKSVDGATIAVVGDLKYGRTVHSLIYLLSRFERMRFVAISPGPLSLPEPVTAYAAAHGHEITIATSLAEALPNADVIYATRLQKERLPEGLDIASLGAALQINATSVGRYAHRDVVIMHPLPRVADPGAYDLATDLDGDPRLAIFRQADNGVAVRMALFAQILGVDQGIEKTLHPATWHRPLTS